MSEATGTTEKPETPKYRITVPGPKPEPFRDYIAATCYPLQALIENYLRNEELMKKIAQMRKPPRADPCE